jgi:DNA-binding GntR family transcriptional regulator
MIDRPPPPSPSTDASGVMKASLAQQVELSLRKKIILGELQPATRLVELEIAKQMGTSQGPVREALQRLEQDGLVVRHSRSATYVSPLSMGEMYEISLVRKTVEGLAIRRTAQCITPAQCEELQTLIEKMQQAGRAGDIATLVDYDMEFHRRICMWSDSTTLLRIWMPLYSQLQRFVVKTHPVAFPDLVEVANNHLPIVETLRNRQPELAAQAIEEHIMLIWSKMEPIQNPLKQGA